MLFYFSLSVLNLLYNWLLWIDPGAVIVLFYGNTVVKIIASNHTLVQLAIRTYSRPYRKHLLVTIFEIIMLHRLLFYKTRYFGSKYKSRTWPKSFNYGEKCEKHQMVWHSSWSQALRHMKRFEENFSGSSVSRFSKCFLWLCAEYVKIM